MRLTNKADVDHICSLKKYFAINIFKYLIIVKLETHEGYEDQFALTYPSVPWVPEISQCTVYHA